MKSTFTTKLLQHLSKKKQEGGFTLIELLVVIIIIGILAAIALPSFLNQANKAKQSEAKTYVGSMNRGQQAYYLENNSFATEDFFTQLGLGIAKDTANYQYSIAASDPAAYAWAIAQPEPNNQSALKAYVGGVKLGTVTGTGEATTLAVLCEALKAPIEGGNYPALDASGLNAGNFNLTPAAGDPECDDTANTGFKDLGR